MKKGCGKLTGNIEFPTMALILREEDIYRKEFAECRAQKYLRLSRYE